MIDTGLLFGSFNPVHTGHLIVAQHFIRTEVCREVWFVVSPQNPFKNSADLAPFNHRLEMVRLAISDNPSFRVCDMEGNLPVPSYTIQTIDSLRAAYPEKSFVLLLGQDVLPSFNKWKNYEAILKAMPVRVFPRHGSHENAIPDFFTGGDVTLERTPRIEISATQIRALVCAGKDLRYLCPAAVESYINREKLYL